jgi:hypothetical protein
MGVLLQPKHLIAACICVMRCKSDTVNDLPNVLSHEKGIGAIVEMMVVKVQYQVRMKNRAISLES